MKKFDINSFVEWAKSNRRTDKEKMLAMYSSIFDGITTDPALMMVPLDDHIVHRGDGVFEALCCVRGNIYNMKMHLARLEESVKVIQLRLPKTIEEISKVIIEVVRAGGEPDCALRVYVSRGPGSLGVDPYDCLEPQLYVVGTRQERVFDEKLAKGARAISSSVPIKGSFWACVKTCNYIPNVMMKKQSRDAGVDFSVGFDNSGFLLEGATENFGIITQKRELLFPAPGSILEGTTMIRVMELAIDAIKQGMLVKVERQPISRIEVMQSAEMIAVGSSIGVVPIIELDGKCIGTGKPGPLCMKLRELLLTDILYNRTLQTSAIEV